MVQLILEGDTLGKRHQHYNKLLKKALEDNSSELRKLNNEDNDLDNLLKIDVASNKRDVEYILEVLRSEDMLYVSRAIRRCVWLITEPQYAHIVNPDYLHTQLFPQMTAKAINKLTLHIRLNLKEEARVESFYNYFKNKNAKSALKWLPCCSLPFVEKEVEKLTNELEISILERLCQKSITILEIYIKNCMYYKRDAIKATIFLVNVHPEKYLDIIEKLEPYEVPYFSGKFTATLMKKNPDRIINNFEKYCDKIDLQIFAKYLKKEDIKSFLLKHVDKESMRSWYQFENLKHFIRYIPKEGRFDFLKKVFIDKAYKADNDNDSEDMHMDVCERQMLCGMSNIASSRSASIYNWYRFAPFDVAFGDLKKMIRNESVPTERNLIMAVLTSCAGRNMQHIHALLRYYHDKHINEPFKFKIQFVNNVISQTDTHLFDDKTWSILNNIFCSLKVYTESENNVQNCIQAIIVYKVLHNEKVPEIVEKKWKTYNTMITVQKRLNKEEKDQLFNYLYTTLVARIQNKNIQKEIDLAEVFNLLADILSLLLNWKKELLDYPWVIDTIKKLIQTNQDNSWNVDLTSLYNKNKHWKKHMFDESLLLLPNEESCVNALKHNSELLTRHKSEVDKLCRNDRVSLRRLLRKIRIYWPESLAKQWADMYIQRLDTPGGHKALVCGLCVLLPQKQLLDIVKKYAPTEHKITWSEDDDLQLSLCKQFAKNVYLARPLPPPDVVLLFAQGDYLQFALPSLNAILYDMSVAHSRENIKKFLDAPVSLQKHGIRLAFTKLESKELKQIFSDIWNSTKNATIRAVLFKQTFNLLCREKQPTVIDEIWELLNVFIDNLSQDEDKTIYETMGKVESVPLSVRARYCMKSYKYLKSLPAKANCEGILESIIYYTRNIMELLDADFMADILLENLDKKFSTKSYSYLHVMSPYLLSAKETNAQTQRYEKILIPLLDRSLELWSVKTNGQYFFRINLKGLLRQLCNDIKEYVFDKSMVFPLEMFTDILNKLEVQLPIENNYIMLRSWKLAVTYVKLLEGQKPLVLSIRGGLTDSELSDRKIWDKVYLNVASDFSENCLACLKDDIKSNFPSIYRLFANALKNMFDNDMMVTQTVQLGTLKTMLGCKDFIESYLLVLKGMPFYLDDDEQIQKANEIRKIISSHPAAEIRMHYYKKYGDKDEVIEPVVPYN